MVNRSPNEGVFKIYDAPESPNKGAAWLRYVVTRTRPMSVRVEDMW